MEWTDPITDVSEGVGRYHCTDNRKTTVSTRVLRYWHGDAPCTRRVNYDEPQRQAGNHECVQRTRRDTGLRVKYNDAQTAVERRRSCMRKYTDSEATTWRYDAITHVGRSGRTKLRTHGWYIVFFADNENIGIRPHDTCPLVTVRETKRNFEQIPRSNVFEKKSCCWKKAQLRVTS